MGFWVGRKLKTTKNEFLCEWHPLANKHISGATYRMINNSKLPNKCWTQQFCPLANIVTLHGFTSFVVILNTSCLLTLHLLLPIPAIWLPQNGHFQLHFRMKIKCSMAFQHLSLLFLICKSSAGCKHPSADLLVISGGTRHPETTPSKLPKIFQNTNYQQHVYQQKPSQTSCPSWHGNAAFISQRSTLHKRHVTTDDNVVHCTCLLLWHWLATGHPLITCFLLSTALDGLTNSCFGVSLSTASVSSV